MRDRDEIRQAICAFANDLPNHRSPGHIFIGVDNQGNPTRLPITDELQRTLSDMRSDGNTLPVPTLTVKKVTLRGVPVAVVEVHPSDSPPVRFKGNVWIRVGPPRAIATLEEERRLTEKQISGARTFDRRACTGSSLDDLLVETFQNDYLPRIVRREVILANQRNVEEQLASLRFFDMHRGAPTNAGILVVGQDPLQHLAGAYIQFARFDGTLLTDAVQDEKQVSGNLLTQLTNSA